MDGRPSVWVGHAGALPVTDLDRSAAHWAVLGMREVERNDQVVVLELRGGTHLVLYSGEPAADRDAPFDLMVEDLDAAHREWTAQGLDPSPIEHGRIHASFTLRDPDGYVVTVTDSHVVGEV